MAKELDQRENRFVEEYLLDLNPERAAISSGYDRSTARSKAHQWVRNSKTKPHVYKAIHKAMQRRLSKLQKDVLRLAYRNHKKGLRISNRDVLMDVYGFEPNRDPKETRAGGILFSRQAIGSKRYNSAAVATVRVFHRLRDRGLIDWRPGSAVTLTPDGIAVAKRLNIRPHKGC